MTMEPDRDLPEGLPGPESLSEKLPSDDTYVSLEEVQNLFREAVDGDLPLTLLGGFKLDFSGNQNFHKVFFSVRCDCGTAALLSVEVGKSKTLSQLKEALPGLVQHLKIKAEQFTNMSCEMHTLMRGGGSRQAPT